MKLDKNSRGTLGIVYSLSGAAIAILAIFAGDHPWISLPLILLIIWFCVWQTAFFRVPERIHAGSGRKVSAVADGRICIIQKAYEGEYLKRESLQVCIYMNFFDVHANFWPVSGKITYTRYHPGKHFLAFKPKASEDNEHTSVVIKAENGQEILFKQIAGTFTRSSAAEISKRIRFIISVFEWIKCMCRFTVRECAIVISVA